MALALAFPALLSLSARAEAPAYTAARATLNVRRAPAPDAALRGLIAKGASFDILGLVAGPGCSGGWAQVAPDGYVCLTDTTPSDQAPQRLPALLPYPTPTPAEAESYRATGNFVRVAGEEPLLPYIYGRRGRRGQPPVYASAAAYAEGQAPIGAARTSRDLLFEGAVDTPKGTVLRRPDGSVVPADSVLLYPIDRFQGRDLLEDPLPEGTLPAWATSTTGLELRTAPDRALAASAVLPYHTPLVLRDAPVDPAGLWWEVPDAFGAGVPGYVEDRGPLRHATVVEPPGDVGEALWLDVDLSEQVLMAWQGGRLRYATLVSTGKAGHETPQGTYRISDKAIFWDMASLPGAAEPYDVAAVPWVMHFAPRYALHGAFWHWAFGDVRSHGCVNLAPRDARWVFEHVGPTLLAGWSASWESPDDPGTVVRIRQAHKPAPDRRGALR